MALKAIKSVGNTPAPATPAPAAQPAAQAPVAPAAPAPAAQPAAQPAQTATPAGNVDQHAVAAPAPRAVVSASELASMNSGVLEGIDDLGNSGNYVTVDGTNFLYKAANETVEYIDIVVSYGKRFYQWVDESNPNAKVFNNSDTKLNDNYKLKFEVRWFEDRGEEEATEFTQTLSTTSSMNFIEYIKGLAKQSLGVNQVVTRLTVSRQVSKDGKNRYSRVEMEAFDYAAYTDENAPSLVSLGVKTPGARTI